MAMELLKYILNKLFFPKMKKQFLFLFCTIVSVICYAQKPIFSFSDVVSLGKVDKVQVINNKGKHVLSKAKSSELIGKFQLMKFHCTNCIKPGVKKIILTISKKEYHFTTRTNSNLIEMDRRLANKNLNLLPENGYDLIFSIENFNIDNY
jgi:hypothetical protein